MDIDKKQIKTATNYSDAIFKIAQSQNAEEKLYKELFSVLEIFKTSKDLKSFLINPLISVNDKKEIIYKIFGKDFDMQIINLLNLLADNKRLNIFDTVCYCYEKNYEEYKNIIKADVISAIDLNDMTKQKLVEKLENKLNKKIIIKCDLLDCFRCIKVKGLMPQRKESLYGGRADYRFVLGTKRICYFRKFWDV